MHLRKKEFLVNPHKISLCILLEIYLGDSSLVESGLDEDVYQELACFLCDELNSKKIDMDDEWSSLFNLVLRIKASIMNQSQYVIDLLLSKLRSIDNPDDLDNLFTSISNMVKPKDSEYDNDNLNIHGRPTHAEGRSVFGLYLRKVNISLTLESFDGISRLYDEILEFLLEYDHCIKENLPYSVSSSIVQDTVTSLAVEKRSFNVLLNYMRERDFEGALDALHRYHDLHDRSAVIGSVSVQYAALNLAVLHFHFGQYREALEGVQEAIRVAQQSNDHVCVAYSLSFLFRLYGSSGNQHTEQLIHDCIERAIESKLPILHTLSGCSSIAYDLIHLKGDDEKRKASNIWKRLEQLFPSFEHDSVPCLTKSLAEFLRLNGKIHLMQATSWEFFGHKVLKESSNQRYLHCYSSGEDLSIAISSCRSLNILLSIYKNDKSSIHRTDYLRAVAFLLQEKFVARNEFRRAEVIVQQLVCMNSPDFSSIHTYIEALIAQIKLLIASKRYLAASKLSKKLIDFCQAKRLDVFLVHLLLLRARILASCSHNLILALPDLLRCLSICSDLQLNSVKAEATVLLATIQLHLGSSGKAQAEVEKKLPHILEHCSTSIQGQAYLIIVKCILSNIGAEKYTLESVLHYLLSYLQQSYLALYQAENLELLREVCFLKSIVYHQINNVDKRDEYATQFHSLSTMILQANDKEVSSLNFLQDVEAIQKENSFQAFS